MDYFTTEIYMNIPSNSNGFNKFNKAVLKSEVSLGEYLVPRPPLQLPTILISLLYLIHSVMLLIHTIWSIG